VLSANGSSNWSASFRMRHLARFPIRRMPLVPLLDRMWELRANVAAYDAAYVALAEALECGLVTRDARLARSSGHAVPIIVR
jgi:predicted nucleic acid-binding protein